MLSDEQWHRIANRLRISRREAEVVQRVFEGNSEATTAWHLGISRHTVHTHMRRLYGKLGVTGHAALMVRVFEAYIMDRAG